MEAIRFNKSVVITGIVFCTLAVITGALGAHAIKSIMGPNAADTWALGSRYQFLHGLAIICLSLFYKGAQKWYRFSFWLFIIGIVLFSGSLYLLSFKSVLTNGFLRIIGPLTPIGGLSFILGWIAFGVGIKKS